MKHIIILLLLGLLTHANSATSNHQSNESHTHSAGATVPQTKSINQSHCDQLIQVDVNGLVCDFCAQALEKVFGQQAAVKGIEVNLDVGEIGIELQPDQILDDDRIKRMIVDSGYHVVSLQRGCDHG